MVICRSTIVAFTVLTLAVAASAGTVTYTYDDTGRLSKADYGGGISVEYAYDGAGNLLTRTAASGETVIYVSPDGLCGGKVRCYSTVQAGINAARDGDTVKVSAGSYPEVVVTGQEKSVYLECGYDNQFTEAASDSTLLKIDHRKGEITLPGGKTVLGKQ